MIDEYQLLSNLCGNLFLLERKKGQKNERKKEQKNERKKDEKKDFTSLVIEYHFQISALII